MKFREFKTKSGKKVLAGKDAKSNEELMKISMANGFALALSITTHTRAPAALSLLLTIMVMVSSTF